METIAHELTHIWQFANWNRKEMSRRYGNRDMVYEGMAEWAAIQFLYLIGETAFARRKRRSRRSYGRISTARGSGTSARSIPCPGGASAPTRIPSTPCRP